MSPPSRASELYARLVSEPSATAKLLADMVKERRPESEFLEFKGVGKITEKDVKHYWSKALSGFANTEGGVLVWGIRAARMPDAEDPSRKIDGAEDFDLAPNPPALNQLLKDVRIEATVDPVLGVETTPVDAGGGDGSGYVICLVPESGTKPHRAALDPAKQYYQRVGDNFVVLPHAILRSMFYPRARAVFRLEADLTWKFPNSTYENQTAETLMGLTVRLRNNGTATGKSIFVVLDSHNIITLENESGRIGLNSVPSKETNWSTGLLHPRMPAWVVFTCAWTVEAYCHSAQGNGFVPLCEAPTFAFTVYAEDQMPQAGRVLFDLDEVSRFRRQTVGVTLVDEGMQRTRPPF